MVENIVEIELMLEVEVIIEDIIGKQQIMHMEEIE